MSNDFVKKVMLEGTKYSNKSKNPYTITASMIGNDLLQNYLTVINGSQPTKKIDDTVLGSVFHRGMEEIIKEKLNGDSGGVTRDLSISTEQNLQHDLPNGWTVSGTADLKLVVLGSAHKSIRDFKLTKMYAINKIRENLAEHNYTSQLNVLKWLDSKDYTGIGSYTLIIDAFAKDTKAVNGEEVHNPIEAPQKHNDVIEAELLQITNLLQQHVESGEIPDQCEELWIRRMRNGTSIPTRCAYYCAHGKSGKCPYYNPTTRETAARVSNW